MLGGSRYSLSHSHVAVCRVTVFSSMFPADAAAADPSLQPVRTVSTHVRFFPVKSTSGPEVALLVGFPGHLTFCPWKVTKNAEAPHCKCLG